MAPAYAGAVLRLLIYVGLALYGHLVAVKGHVVLDGLGSITELTNNSGVVVWSYVYDSFGHIKNARLFGGTNGEFIL